MQRTLAKPAVALLPFDRPLARRGEQLRLFAASNEDGCPEDGRKYRRDASMKSDSHVDSSFDRGRPPGACCGGCEMK
jgi:hypothetical protein